MRTLPGEIDTEDNKLFDGIVYVGILGDVNTDGKVNMVDLWEVQRRFGRTDPNYDIDCNGIINMIDLWITQKNFGQIDP